MIILQEAFCSCKEDNLGEGVIGLLHYEAQVYSGGEACDITGKRRETEVHFVCSEEGKEGIKSIREHATCQYTLVFASPRVCKHPGFQIPKQPVHTIVCGRLGGSQQIEEEMPAQHHVVKEQATGKHKQIL